MGAKSVGTNDHLAAREARSSGDVEALLQILAHGDRIGRLTAARGLGSLQSTKAVRPLIRCIRANDELLQVSALKALAQIGDQGAVADVFEVATWDESLGVRATAAETLARLGDDRAPELLGSILVGEQDELHSRSYRRWAVKLLVESVGARAIPHLEAAKERAGPLERLQLRLAITALKRSRREPRGS
jgi:HEAT repeat protein